MNEENNIQNLEEKRRQKAKSFTLNIQDDIYDESAKTENNEPEELNSYSGEDVKEQMAKNSKQALKKKKKIDKKLSKAKNKRNRRVFRVIWLVSVIIVGAMAGMFFVAGIDDMLAINRTEEKNVRIEIPANPNLDTVATVLEKIISLMIKTISNCLQNLQRRMTILHRVHMTSKQIWTTRQLSTSCLAV